MVVCVQFRQVWLCSNISRVLFDRWFENVNSPERRSVQCWTGWWGWPRKCALSGSWQHRCLMNCPAQGWCRPGQCIALWKRKSILQVKALSEKVRWTLKGEAKICVTIRLSTQTLKDFSFITMTDDSFFSGHYRAQWRSQTKVSEGTHISILTSNSTWFGTLPPEAQNDKIW